MKEEENELKLLIEKEGYYRALEFFEKVRDPIEQVNYYFESPERFFQKNGITLRVRKIENKYTLTVKIKNSFKNNIVKSYEFHKPISINSFYDAVDNPNHIYKLLNNDAFEAVLTLLGEKKELKYLGYINNKRSVLKAFNTWEIDLDCTKFPNEFITYEIEVENILNTDEFINKLNIIGITGQITDKGKYNRFLKLLSDSTFKV